MRARDIMSGPVMAVTPETTVKQAAELLASHGFTALPVLDDADALVGVVSEADLVADRFPAGPDHEPTTRVDSRIPGATVGEVMTSPAISVAAGADVVDVVTLMLDDRVRSVPVVEGARVVGVVTRRDLVGVLARDDKAISDDVRHQLEMYGAAYRWTVEVHDGVVVIGDEFDNATDRHVARVLAEAVRGVTAATVVSQSPND
jgi:CBS-domain-containing membrane protein